MRWTSDNTEGWSSEEMDMLNRAQEALEGELLVGLDEEKTYQMAAAIAAALNNEWTEGVTYDALLERARARLS